jgi:transposase-like protein
MRLHFDSEFKTTVLELLRADKSVREVCEEYKLQDGTIRRWRREYFKTTADLSKKWEPSASEVELSPLKK